MDMPIQRRDEAANVRPIAPFAECTAELIALRDIAEHWRGGGIVLGEDLATFVRSTGRILAVIDQLAEGYEREVSG